MQEKNLIFGGLVCVIIGIIIISLTTIEISSTIKINEPLDINIYFCPNQDCKEIIINTIKEHNKIHCALYDLDIPELQDLLKQKQAQLITDKKNKVSNSITNKGYQLMHNKFCILDDETIITGSMNPTERGTSSNNNNLVIIKSKELAKNYEQEFQELYKGKFGSGEKTKYTKFKFINITLENYFCPEDKCSEKIIKHLQNAKESVYFMTFSFTHNKIADTLIKKYNQGIEIKGIMEKQRINMEYNKYKYLKENNITIFTDKNPSIMHHKVFIIDNQTVIFGSMNPTKAADTKNDENILIIQNKEIAQQFLEEFNSLI